MLPPETLLARIRAEYREMPGLRLTLVQACRLWQVDAATCTRVLRALIEEGFLIGRQDGTFIALPTTRLNAAKVEPLPTGMRRGA
jgi:hypothetical protein